MLLWSPISGHLLFAAQQEHFRLKQTGGGEDHQDAQQGLPADGSHVAPRQEPDRLHPHRLRGLASPHDGRGELLPPSVVHAQQRRDALGGGFVGDLRELVIARSPIARLFLNRVAASALAGNPRFTV